MKPTDQQHEEAMQRRWGKQTESAQADSVQRDGSNASIVEAIKETDRHMEELYRQAGEGRIVTGGLNAARERASALTQALIQSKHLNAGAEQRGGENRKP